MRWNAAGARVALALLAAASLSCSDLPTKPLRLTTVTGTILDRNGAPLEGFHITFMSRLITNYRRVDPHLYAWANTGPDGRYELSQMYEGTYDVGISGGSYSGYNDVYFSAAVGPGAARVDYRYSGIRITGQVYGPGGTRLAGATAQAILRNPTGGYGSFLESIDWGQGFSLFGDPGTYEFRIYPPYGSSGIPSLRLTGIAIHADTTLDIHLDGYPIAGLVTGPDGQALPGVRVYAYNGDGTSCSASSGSDGRYVLRLPAGAYRWNLTTPGSLAYIASREFPPMSVTSPATYDFDMGGARWTARVRLLPDSLPARGYYVSVRSEGYTFYAQAATRTDSAGVFQVVLPPGSLYQVELDQPDPGRLYWYVSDLLAGADSTLDLVLDPAAGQERYILATGALTRRTAAEPPAPERMPRPALLPRR